MSSVREEILKEKKERMLELFEEARNALEDVIVARKEGEIELEKFINCHALAFKAMRETDYILRSTKYMEVNDGSK